MKSRIIDSFREASPWPSRDFSRLSKAGIALGGVISVLTLSGCYYPYGYYPAGSYAPVYATPPAATAQPPVPADQADSADTQQQRQPAVQAQAQAQGQMPMQDPNATYAVAAPAPVYAAPVYPAYYPPPVVYAPYPAYPAYYGHGYPYYGGPSISIGVGGYWGGGWGHHWH